MVPLSFTATPIYNKPAIRFPQSGSIGEIEIPMHITKLSTQNEGSKLTEVTYGAVLDLPSNLGSGGTTYFQGPNEMSKINVEGFIDTPTTIVPASTPVIIETLYPAPNLYPSPTLFPSGGILTNEPGPSAEYPSIIIDGNKVTYGEILAAYFEGRTTSLFFGSFQLDVPWVQVLPRWFRDAYGRVYTNPRIIELTLQRVEAVPGRNNFTMILQVN